MFYIILPILVNDLNKINIVDLLIYNYVITSLAAKSGKFNLSERECGIPTLFCNRAGARLCLLLRAIRKDGGFTRAGL